MRKILIVGAGGRLGAALAREYARDFAVRGYNHAELDLAQPDKWRDRVEREDFDLMINAAAMTAVDRCETERDLALRINATAPRHLAEIARSHGVPFIHISTDYVFDGEQRRPYRESDSARPISAYGASKKAGEDEVLATYPESLVVRVSWVFGPDRPSFVDQMIRQAREKSEVSAVADKFSTPSYTLDLARALRVSWGAQLSGMLHLANAGECSWQEYAQHALDCCRAEGIPIRTKKVGASKLAEMKNFIARRPVYSALDSGNYTAATGEKMRDWREAVADYIRTHYSR